MSKINNHGFCILKTAITREQIWKLRKELDVKPESTFGNFSIKSFKVYKETKSFYILPIYYVLENFNIPHSVFFPEPEYINISDTILLRDSQQECFKKCCEEYNKPYGGGIINLSTASGKTVLAIKLVCFFKLKTLIIVNKIELLEQWKKEITKWVPGVKIGIIQGSTFDYEDKDIVIGMLQTISIKQSLKPLDFSWVGMSIIDEIHNVSSEIFSKVLFKVRPRFMFGLTATLERKDKLEKIIKWCIGDVIYSNINTELKQSTEIHIYKYDGDSSKEHQLRDGTAAVAKMLTNIGNDSKRTDMIIDILKNLLTNNKRNILVISDRIAQLKYIHKYLPEDSGLFIGSLKSAELEHSKTKRILLGTYALVNEGFNLPKLNSLIFATPRSSIVQSIGRIYRKDHEIAPVIVDIFDDFSIFRGQHYRRKGIYKKSIKDCLIMTKSIDKSIDNKQGKILTCLLDDDTDDELDLDTCLIEE